eukprot:gene10215-11264_t
MDARQISFQEYLRQHGLNEGVDPEASEIESDDEVPIPLPVKKKASKKTAEKKPAAEKASKKKKTAFNWSDDLVEEMINQWQLHPVLYDISNPNYHLKDKRRNAIQKVLDVLEEQDRFTLPTYEDANKKMNSLRSYFVAEKNKTHQSRVSGAGADDVYRSKWQFFESLSFLADNIVPRTTESNLPKQRSTETQDAQNSQQYAYDIGDNNPSSKKSKKTEAKRTDELIETAIDALKKPRAAERERTADQIFGEMVWKMLAEIPEGYEKDMAKMDIQRQLMQLKHGQPMQQSTVMYPPPQPLQQQQQFRRGSHGTPPSLDYSRAYPRAHSNISFESEQDRCSEKSFTILD